MSKIIILIVGIIICVLFFDASPLISVISLIVTFVFVLRKLCLPNTPKFVKVGIDIVQIPRIEKVWNRYNMKFAKKILHQEELEHLNKKNFSNTQIIHYLAKRFAAKEAVSKALGVGMGKYISFRDILIINNDLGMPKVIVEEAIIRKIMIERLTGIDLTPNTTINVSISDDYPTATAIATLNYLGNTYNIKL